MSKKIVIVGGVAGGASAAARIRRLDEQAEIVMLERGHHVSFSNCALPFYLSGMVASSGSLVLMDPVKFKKQYNIDARVNSEVTEIDRTRKVVKVKDLSTGSCYDEPYDVLVLSPGAAPIRPESIQGIHLPHVFTVRNVDDIVALKQYVDTNAVAQVAVVGGGFIGVEVAENLRESGKAVTMIEAMDQIMAPFDLDMAQILHKEMVDHGVDLILGDGVKQVEPDKVILNSGKTVEAGAVVMAIGVRPETSLAKAAGLALGETGGIQVDANYKTSDPSIYAVGDAIEVYNRLAHKTVRLPLAGPAQRQARAAANDICGLGSKNHGVIGSSIVKLFGLKAASTGLNEKTAKAAGIPYDFVYIIPNDKVSIMPGNSPVHFKLLFEKPTGRILGAQAIGKGSVDKRIDVIAAMIAMNADLGDLQDLELCYAPLFGTAKDVVNYAAMVALNVQNGVFRQVPVTAVRSLVENNACIIDVREENEFEAGHLLNAKNIPLSQLRARMDEIPRDRPVYLHCRSSQRSYNAIMALQGQDYDNLWNISGSFLGICLYEYFTDLTKGREKIVTAYNFK